MLPKPYRIELSINWMTYSTSTRSRSGFSQYRSRQRSFGRVFPSRPALLVALADLPNLVLSPIDEISISSQPVATQSQVVIDGVTRTEVSTRPSEAGKVHSESLRCDNQSTLSVCLVLSKIYIRRQPNRKSLGQQRHHTAENNH